MAFASNVFDNSIAKWKQESNSPWAKLKYKLVQANLAKHLGRNRLRVLDAGGGNGLDSIPLAAQGYLVDIVDSSQEMLADVPYQAIQQANAMEHLTTHHADLKDIANLFPPSHYDLILCHNVLQYIDDVLALFEDFARLLKPDGLVSIVSINRFSIPYHSAFIDDNLSEALARLHQRKSQAKAFDAVMTCYSADEIIELMTRAGLATERDYGIRCICDYWGDNERKLNPAIFDQIERLEFDLTELYPYKLLARYFQIVARRIIDG